MGTSNIRTGKKEYKTMTLCSKRMNKKEVKKINTGKDNIPEDANEDESLEIMDHEADQIE